MANGFMRAVLVRILVFLAHPLHKTQSFVLGEPTSQRIVYCKNF